MASNFETFDELTAGLGPVAVYRSLVEASPASLVVADSAGRILIVNQLAREMFGIDATAVGRSVFEWVPPEEIETARHEFQQLLATKTRRCIEITLRRENGERFLAEISGAVVNDPAGRPRLSVLVCSDITDRRHAEQATAAAARDWSVTFDAMSDGVSLLSPDHTILNINDSLCRLVGKRKDEAIGQKCYRLLHGLEVPPAECPLEKSRVTSWRHDAEVFEPLLDRWFAVSTAPVLDDGGRLARLVHVVRDITKRKRAEEALRESEAKYRTLLDNIPLGVFYKDADSVYIAANPAYAATLGREPADVVGRTDYELFAHDVAEQHRQSDRRVLATGSGAERDETVMVRGEQRIFRALKHPVLDQQGSPVGVLGMIWDVTDRELVQRSLRQAKEAAEAASRAKGEFLANMSHEIRTPMTAILGFSDLLMSPALSRDERREYLEGIRRNAKALLELINRILDLSRIEADKLLVEKHLCSLQGVVDDAMSVVQGRAEEKGLSLDVDYQPPLPETIATDALRLRQILVNLLGNAVKFTERGAVRLSVGCDGRTATFAVSDTGIGIPPERLGELFQPFVQLDGSASRRYSGTGLGLAISQHLARAMGGDIEVASQPGKGSTFTLRIDIASRENVAAPSAPEAAGQRLLPDAAVSTLCGRVLLAEDVPDVQRVVVQLLRRFGIQVEIASSGLAACQMAANSQAERNPYDLVLMDIQLPELNGYDATQWLRRHGWQGPIVALTAHAAEGDRERCLQAGCNDYLPKPFSPAALRETLARHLPSARADDSGTTKPATAGRTLLGSDFLDADTVAGLLDAFVAELPSRGERIEKALHDGNRPLLAELTHQLKGTAALYGFAAIATKAEAVYELATAQTSRAQIETVVAELLRLCREARS